MRKHSFFAVIAIGLLSFGSVSFADVWESISAAPGNYPPGSFEHYFDVNGRGCYREITFQPEYIAPNNGSGTTVRDIRIHFANGEVRRVNQTLGLHPLGQPYGLPSYTVRFQNPRRVVAIEFVAASFTATHSRLDILGSSVRCNGGGEDPGRPTGEPINLPPFRQTGSQIIDINQRAQKIIVAADYITPNNGSGSYIFYVDVTFGNGRTRRLFNGSEHIQLGTAKDKIEISLRNIRNIVSVEVTGSSATATNSLVRVRVE